MKIILTLLIISLVPNHQLFAKTLRSSALKSSNKTEKKSIKVVSSPTKIELMLKNGHLNKVVIGWSNNASDGYDQSLDFLAPPAPGMGTGFSALLLDDKKMKKYHFYQIIHKPSMKMSWNLLLKVHDKKKITISWKQSKLPKGYAFSIKTKKRIIAMDKVSSITIATSETINIVVTKIMPKKMKKGNQ